MKKLNAFALLALLTGCQAGSLPAPSAAPPAGVRTLATGFNPQAALPPTAKIVDEEAQNLAKQWSPHRALTHVLCQNITSEGVPHVPSGSWTFSFIDREQPEKGLQVILRTGLKPQVKQVAADKLINREPLEIRAWGVDSPKAIIKGRQYFGEVSLKRFELTGVKGRLVWSFGPGKMVEAFDGSQFNPDLKR